MSDLDSNQRSCLHAAACGGYVRTITCYCFTTRLTLYEATIVIAISIFGLGDFCVVLKCMFY